MKYSIRGQVITNKYIIDQHGGTKSPTIEMGGIDVSHKEFYSTEADVKLFERRGSFGLMLNPQIMVDGEMLDINNIYTSLSDDSEIVVLETDKIISETKEYPDQALLDIAINAYYQYVIDNNPDVERYIRIHDIKNPQEKIDEILKMCESRVYNITNEPDTFATLQFQKDKDFIAVGNMINGADWLEGVL